MTEAAGTAVLDPANSASLEASAGSGKTWQLVSRVVRLLLEGAEPGGILALTFTRKAAVEMRLRLNERLRMFATADDAALREALSGIGVTPDAAVLARARSIYRELLFTPFPPRAMTLHAFCQELLARFALEARVPPDFGLYENEEELVERSWRRLQARLIAEPDAPPARALRTLVDLGFNEFTLRDLVTLFIAHRGDWWAYTSDLPRERGSGADQDDATAYATGRLRAELGPCDADAALREIDSAACNAYLGTLWRWLREWGNVGSVKAERLEPAVELRGAARLEALADALLTKDGEPYAFQPGRKFADAQRASLLETHGEVLRRFSAAHDQWTRAQSLRRSEAAFTLGEAALAALREELAREHALGFTELEWHTCRLLQRDGAPDWVRYRMDRRVDHLLIDEFQDTSPTQWRMLLPLLEEMAAGESGRARSLFIVGDAKQSIYGFRRADPRLLGRATQWMQERLQARSAPLHHSRRSAPAIINFVNALFAHPEVGERIDFALHDTHRRDDWGRVEIAPLVPDATASGAAALTFRDPLARARLTREDLRARTEAEQVSRRIRALIDSGVEVTTQAGRHRIGYGDIMVLARARTHLHHLERQLTADGIPFVGAARGTLLETSIARDLMALLRLLDAPHRDLELAQVLRSPLFGAGDEALVKLAAEVRAHGGTWVDALGRLARDGAPGAPVFARAHDLLGQWRALAARLPAHDLVDRIVRDTDAAERYEAALPRVTGARARANLGAFLQLALEADSGRYPSLPRFLQWLEAQQRAFQNAPDEPPPAAATEQVRIMTIHAAKGLEAAAVFLVNTGSQQGPRTPRLLIEWPQDHDRPTRVCVTGPGAKLDVLARAVADGHKAREVREELNVLYVAATRARHFLHISGFAPAKASARSWHGYAWRAMEPLERAAPLPGTIRGSLCHAVGVPAVTARPAAAPPTPSVDPRLRKPLTVTAALATPSARVDERSAFETPETAARGTAIHYLLQRLSQAPAGDDDLWNELRARLDVEPARQDFSKWLVDARALLGDTELARFFDPTRYHKAWNEVPILVDNTTAAIDRLVDDGAHLWVIDYKTHTRPDAALLVERYRPQLAAYAGAIEKVWPGRPVRAGLILTATRTWVPVLG
jgi:ATP-dependent helicase/nuclease subunit A